MGASVSGNKEKELSAVDVIHNLQTQIDLLNKVCSFNLTFFKQKTQPIFPENRVCLKESRE